MRALVLLSGGLDSAVALWHARAAGHEVVALSFRYPGRPLKEARAARELARLAAVPHHEADLPFLREPEGGAFALAPRGYIPGRNALFYAAAAYHAEIVGCQVVVGGHNADDAARFPDARASFFQRLGALLDAGLWGLPGRPALRLEMPLATLTKKEVVALGRSLRVPLALAWSCYEDGEAPCGACPSCLERATLLLARAGGAD